MPSLVGSEMCIRDSEVSLLENNTLLTAVMSLTMKKVAVLADFKLFKFSPRSISWYCRKNGKMNVVNIRAVPSSSISSVVPRAFSSFSTTSTLSFFDNGDASVVGGERRSAAATVRAGSSKNQHRFLCIVSSSSSSSTSSSSFTPWLNSKLDFSSLFVYLYLYVYEYVCDSFEW